MLGKLRKNLRLHLVQDYRLQFIQANICYGSPLSIHSCSSPQPHKISFQRLWQIFGGGVGGGNSTSATEWELAMVTLSCGSQTGASQLQGTPQLVQNAKQNWVAIVFFNISMPWGTLQNPRGDPLHWQQVRFAREYTLCGQWHNSIGDFENCWL